MTQPAPPARPTLSVTERLEVLGRRIDLLDQRLGDAHDLLATIQDIAAKIRTDLRRVLRREV